MKEGEETVLLTSQDVHHVIKNVGFNEFMDELIEEVKKAFLDHQRGNITARPRTSDSGYLWADGKTIEVMHASNKDACFKIVNYHPKNSELGFPTVMATGIYLEVNTGFPKMIADMTLLTALRTGAASAIATQLLGRKDSKTLGIMGAGFQGEANLHALSRVMSDLEEVYVYDINDRIVKSFAERMKKICNVQIEVSEVQSLVEKSDVIVTCTYADGVVIENNWVKEGTHINAVGADTRGKQELDYKIIQRAKVVVDILSQAKSEGEINVPIGTGRYYEDDVYAELGEIVLYTEVGYNIKSIKERLIGKGKKGRVNDNEITIFDSTGTSFEDLAALRLLSKHLNEKYGKRLKFTYIPSEPEQRSCYSLFL
ncbi:MAG: hypothetical protein KAT65_16600 [Methanophagales archaeon]|nr:hypothetical protein [Methanophagales archaeon]